MAANPDKPLKILRIRAEIEVNSPFVLQANYTHTAESDSHR